MLADPVIVSLPTADRRTAFDFYRAALGLDAIGDPADDGVPEPLQFVVNDGLRLMLIPRGGFDWVTGDHEVAPSGVSECTLGLGPATDAEVDAIVERARAAGATVVSAPERRPWGYTGAFADPDGHIWMVRSQAS